MKQVRSHETNHNAGRLFGAALTLGTLIGGLSAEASAGASSPNLHQQTGATMAGIEDGKGTVLPDLYNTYKSGTVLYKTASSSGGHNIYAKIGPDEMLRVHGIVAGKNPVTGDAMQAITLVDNNTSTLVWAKYAGLKTEVKNSDPGNAVLHRDQAYAPHIGFSGSEIIATYNQAHINLIDTDKPIGNNQAQVGVGYLSPTS